MSGKNQTFSADKCNVPLNQKDGVSPSFSDIKKFYEPTAAINLENSTSTINLQNPTSTINQPPQSINHYNQSTSTIIDKLDQIIEDNRVIKKRMDNLERLILESNQSQETRRIESNDPGEQARRNTASLTILISALNEIAKKNKSAPTINLENSTSTINLENPTSTINQPLQSINLYNQS